MKQAFKNGVGFTLGVFVGEVIIKVVNKLIVSANNTKKNNSELCKRMDATDEPTDKTEQSLERVLA